MKKLYPLVIACLFASQIFAEDSKEVVKADDEAVLAKEVVTESEVDLIDVTAAAQKEVEEVIEKLQKDGLTPEQILEKAQVVLEEEDSTQAAYRSILNDQKTQERVALILAGAVVAIALEHLAWPYVAKPLFEKVKNLGAKKGAGGVPAGGENPAE